MRPRAVTFFLAGENDVERRLLLMLPTRVQRGRFGSPTLVLNAGRETAFQSESNNLIRLK